MDPSQLAWAALAAANAAMAATTGALYWRERRRSAGLRKTLSHAESQIDTLISHDSLTGLRGRDEFELALDQALHRCDHGGPGFSVLYVDIDHLKSVNTAFGHAAGDAVLREAAQRLAQGDVVASRIAADEFALLVAGDASQALEAARTLVTRLHRPFTLAGGHEVRLSCSVGIAGYPHHGSRPQLLGKAMLAMRSVKGLGGAAHAEYTPQLGDAQREQAELLHDLQQALEQGQFELYYQPKVDAASLQITAAEALVRWQHPRRGLVSPALFVPLAERHGLMARLGDWVLAEACRQAGEWRRLGLRMRVAVNVSGVQLRQDDLAVRLQALLTAHRVPAGRFTCEITETVAMEDTQATRQAFDRLRATGVHVSIDDFGTGHSSLAMLRRLPAAELKIDGAFVADLATSRDARTIVSAIVRMAHTLGLRVVAEGVESEAQRDQLVDLGVEEMQGFLFARPMTAQALTLWATDDRPGQQAQGDFRASLFSETLPSPLPR